uniref:Sacsin/Nov domain-containing protein n=1 Tax=Sparus aurata TaxID=8175 RepID=A0A671V136_SPAAU
MEEKTRFPTSTFTSSPDILHSLRQLGLRNEVQLSEKDALKVAKKIEELQGSKEPEWEFIIKKAKTLLQILNKQTKLVKSTDAQTSLLKLKWVPVCKERPLTYPKSLAWVGDTLNIFSLSEMCDISHAVLVGSAVALVEHTSAGMKKALKLTVEPQVDQVLQIKNILEEYPSVADIFKELLQNADDASATECSFLIDMRKNTDIRENLLDPGMIVCHGPSLWSFNNSVFSDTDFLNITRLGGSVKRCEADKVGKFGLGFNSVYHITDIPIIMSREFMIMFDPNINHISKHIRDSSNPGIKINWSKQQKRLRKFPNQFKPFINVFNCQLPLAQDSPYKYNGTLFRLPFRTEQEASVSEISSLYYNTTDIYSLVDEFSICGHRFILFTQHVGSMKVASTNRARRMTDEMPSKAVEVTNWLICSCMDVTEALKFSLSDSGKRLGLVPCGGVAVLLSEEENRKWTVKTNATPIGEVFCYLPLRIKTGLPVHINGCFAVTSNRKEIWKTDTKGQWNSVFMRHVIVQAYLAALTMLRSMAESGELLDYSYYAAWPDPSQVHDDFTLVSQGVYQEIAKGGDSDQAKVFSDGKTWVSIKYVRFLDDALLCRPDIGPAAFQIFLKYLKKSGSQNLCAVELPDWVKEGFDDAGCKGKLMENTLTEKQFFSDVFFPHIQEIDKELRDPLMHFVLNEKLEDFASILRVTPCIPCSGPNKELVLPSRLIHPEGRVAKLYNTDDGRFP